MNTRSARLARGSAAAVFATLTALFSHLLGGGMLPSPAALALALAAAVLICVALSGRSLSLWRLAVAVGLSQLAFHTLFSRMAGESVDTTLMAGHHEHVLSIAGAFSPESHSAPSMVLAHVLAGILTVAVLRSGEAAFWGLRDTAFLAMNILLRPLVVLPPRPRALVIDWSRSVLPRNLGVLLSTMRHRGPPVSFAL